MIFKAKNAFTLQWTLVDQSNNPINNAVVTATLYSGRSIVNPDTYPGTAVSPITNLTLTYVPASNGIYQVAVPATLDPPPDITNYTLVIDGTVSSVAVYHYEEPSTVVIGSDTSSEIDLVSLETLKSWLSIPLTNTGDDSILQLLISSFSQYVLNRTGIKSFNSIQSYTDTLDGDNSTRIFLRNNPIVAVSSLVIGAFTPPQSSGPTSNGWYIEDNKKSLAFRIATNTFMTGVPNGIYPYAFLRGQGNIVVSYTAGYTSVPFDLEEAVMKACAINYKRKDWVDLASKSLASGQGVAGTTSYRKWMLPPEIISVLDFYSKQSWS